VLAEGDHDLSFCQQITEQILATIFKSLSDYNVYLEGCLLKTVNDGFFIFTCENNLISIDRI